MKTKNFRRFSMVLIMLAIILVNGYAQNKAQDKKPKTASELKKDVVKYKVTFIELGSVRCIPCRQMQPIMKSIEQKYGDQVKVVFYDVWTPEGRPYADKYSIQVIPTQVFLGNTGKEFFRHEGYFPEEELVKMLNKNGIR